MDNPVFAQKVKATIKLYEKTIGHYASRTRQLIDAHGETDALSLLMLSADLQKRFKVLRDKNMLEHTFEALVIEFHYLFKPEIVEAAQWRLDNTDDLLN